MKKKQNVVASVHIKIGNEYVGRLARKRIHLDKNNKTYGTLSDGRRVKKVPRKGWVYKPPK